MKTIGIIAEFNPFHNGHQFLINEAKRQTNASHVIIVMSGNYIQRGGPAFLDKHLRTRIALENGADLVIELPFYFSMAKASVFASGAIQIFNELGITDYLCFGCEQNSLRELDAIAAVSAEEPELYKRTLQANLHKGYAYSHAKELAISEYFRQSGNPLCVTELLSKPNAMLAIEYLTALKRTNSSIIPWLIRRTDCGYHSLEITSMHNISFASAHALRKKILAAEDISSYVPTSAVPIYNKYAQKRYPITETDFSAILGYTLAGTSVKKTLADCFDISVFTANRISNHKTEFQTTEAFIQALTSKSITAAYLRRGLFMHMLGFTQAEFEVLTKQPHLPYVSVLGFNKKGAELLKLTKEIPTPIITTEHTAQKQLSGFAADLYHKAQYADNIYRMMIQHKYSELLPSEQQLYHQNFNS